MYVNSFATSAKILDLDDVNYGLLSWYNREFGTNYTVSQFVSDNFFDDDEYVVLTNSAPADVIKTNAYYWLATANGSNGLYYVYPGERLFMGDNAFGVRVLINLDSDVYTKIDAGDGSVDNPYQIFI